MVSLLALLMTIGYIDCSELQHVITPMGNGIRCGFSILLLCLIVFVILSGGRTSLFIVISKYFFKNDNIECDAICIGDVMIA